MTRGMLMVPFLVCVLVVCLGVMPGLALDADVQKGISEVENGDYDAAIVTLDIAARRLAGQREREADLARAYLYMGIAYVGKGHEAAARARFRQAVHELRDLSLSPEQFPPKVIGIFEAAREEELRIEAAEAPTPASSPASTTAAKTAASAQPAPAEGKKKGGGKKWLFIGGGVLAAGVVAGAASGGGSSGPSPTVTAHREPLGTAIAGVTETDFSADAANVTAPTYSWDFGDGMRGSGQRTAYVYPATGDFVATVTVSGSEGTAQASVNVAVGSVDGNWESRSDRYVVTFVLQPSDRGVGGRFTFESLIDGVWVRTEEGAVEGDLVNPRQVHVRENGRCGSEFDGEFNDSLENMVGTLCRRACPDPDTGQSCWDGTSFARVH